ncbi:MAG: M20/M25/M40 family metallo-hydrolase [Candidatus Aminicenantia bacterium]
MKEKKIILILAFLIGLNYSHSFSIQIPKNPKIEEIINLISGERIAQILQKLESFETRNLLSEPTKNNFGIKAAGEWIFKQFKSFGPKLNVYFDRYQLKKQGTRIIKDVELRNIVAILPGKYSGKNERIFIVNAHYDSIARSEDGHFHFEDVNTPAPGVNDDGSGVAAILEMARVLSQYQFEATIYFVAFAGEEQGLVGSSLFAQKMKKEGKNIQGVITLDMIGNIEGGNGFIGNQRIRVFCSELPDSSSQQLARYIKRTGEKYFPWIKIEPIFRMDRFGRGGDHIPFLQEGFAGIRVMEANENYSQQHTIQDRFKNISLSYCLTNTRIVASCLASLAWAPPSPEVVNAQGFPLLTRGKSGYDAYFQWKLLFETDDLAGYKVFIRKTTASFWEKEILLEKVSELLLKNLSIDEYIFGVAAFDLEGNESPASSYIMPPRRKVSYQILN